MASDRSLIKVILSLFGVRSRFIWSQESYLEYL